MWLSAQNELWRWDRLCMPVGKSMNGKCLRETNHWYFGVLCRAKQGQVSEDFSFPPNWIQMQQLLFFVNIWQLFGSVSECGSMKLRGRNRSCERIQDYRQQGQEGWKCERKQIEGKRIKNRRCRWKTRSEVFGFLWVLALTAKASLVELIQVSVPQVYQKKTAAEKVSSQAQIHKFNIL